MKTLIVIHCSATRENEDYTEKHLERDHLKRGIRSPGGYHFYIRKDGTIITLRPIDRTGAHAKGFNKEGVGICYEGGLDANGKAKDTRTDEQKGGILEAIRLTLISEHAKIKKIVGHRDLSEDKNKNGKIDSWERMKECPCFDAIEEYEWILS